MANNKGGDYWEEFYSNNSAPERPSRFAEWVVNYLKEEFHEKPLNLLDVGCGNGRDSFFFLQEGYSVVAVDPAIDSLSPPVDSADRFIFLRESALNVDYSKPDVVYFRFVFHSLTQSAFVKLLDRVNSSASGVAPGALLFFETRSSKGVTGEPVSDTHFSSPVGEEHLRVLYSLPKLSELISIHAPHLDIVQIHEDSGFAPYDWEDPVCIRGVLKKRLK